MRRKWKYSSCLAILLTRKLLRINDGDNFITNYNWLYNFPTLGNTIKQIMNKSLFKYSHNDSKHGIFPCSHPGCNGVFNTKYSWKRHQLIHKDVKEFACSSCDKRFVLQQQLKEHVYSHTKERPYVCNINGCQRNFRHASELSLHRRIHPEFVLRKYHYLKRKNEIGADNKAVQKFAVVYAKSSESLQSLSEKTVQMQEDKTSLNNSKKPEIKTQTYEPSESLGEVYGLDMNYLEYLANITTSTDRITRPILPLPGCN